MRLLEIIDYNATAEYVVVYLVVVRLAAVRLVVVVVLCRHYPERFLFLLERFLFFGLRGVSLHSSFLCACRNIYVFLLEFGVLSTFVPRHHSKQQSR